MSKTSYGGFIITPNHGVILVSPTSHYSGVHWTFPKGGGDSGESNEKAALREVEEECGFKCEIICKIPNMPEFKDDYSNNEYYLMRIVSILSGSGGREVKGTYHGKEYKNKYTEGETDAEADIVVEASKLAAIELINKTTSTSERKRDLALIEAGYRCYEEWLTS